MTETSTAFKGGSLNSVNLENDTVIKSYDGPIPRGAEKLKKEADWLRAIPKTLKEKFPRCFPNVVEFSESERGGRFQARLAIELLPRTSITKTLLSNRGTDSVSAFQDALAFTLEELYPLEISDSPKGYFQQVHANRISLARKFLRRLPYLQPILEASTIVVNGIETPTLNRFLSWLDSRGPELFNDGSFIKFHGNFHFDNILVDYSAPQGKARVSLIDPRGEFLGPPHYDLSKMLITLAGYYDEVHYGLYHLEHNRHGRRYEFTINIDTTYFQEAYTSMLANLPPVFDAYMNLENSSDHAKYTERIVASQLIHILSFCFYHAYGTEPLPDKVRAFLAIFFLKLKLFFDNLENLDFQLFANRLELQ